jgi:small subunit ribosomal protein S20
MPHNLSAKKRLRQNEVRRLRNKARASELKTIRKKLLRAIHDKQKPEAEVLYKDLSKRLDQAASVRTIHKNAAARTKSRIALKIQALAAKPATA